MNVDGLERINHYPNADLQRRGFIHMTQYIRRYTLAKDGATNYARAVVIAFYDADVHGEELRYYVSHRLKASDMHMVPAQWLELKQRCGEPYTHLNDAMERVYTVLLFQA